MKTKLFFQIIVIIIIFQKPIFGQRKYYTIEQIKDTLVKYENPYKAFDKLDLYKIPINKFRKDSFLIKKANQLLDIKYFREYIFLRNTNEDLIYLRKFEWERRSEIKRYLKNVRKIPQKKLTNFYDSISRNPTLIKKYTDSVYRSKRYNDSINYSKYNWETTLNKYITFHSKLMTQTGYDTIRSYYDRYYSDYKGFNKSVIIALINMGDPEIRNKYENWFENKLTTKTFGWNDYTFIKNNFKESYKYKKLSRLLLSDIVMEILGEKTTIKRHIAFSDFPLIDTITGKPCMDMYSKMIQGNYDFNHIPYSSYEEISKYFMDYAAYLEKREKSLFKTIKYKTNN